MHANVQIRYVHRKAMCSSMLQFVINTVLMCSALRYSSNGETSVTIKNNFGEILVFF